MEILKGKPSSSGVIKTGGGKRIYLPPREGADGTQWGRLWAYNHSDLNPDKSVRRTNNKLRRSNLERPALKVDVGVTMWVWEPIGKRVLRFQLGKTSEDKAALNPSWENTPHMKVCRLVKGKKWAPSYRREKRG